ncbi:MAG TPA: hypothetical protein VHP83_06655 [Aggregatilineaceae bacterium]|nr:hypothetical protein [Aggregatilineaceae bacterium]
MMFDIRTLLHPDDLTTVAAFQADHQQPDVRFDHAALVTLAHNGGLILGAYTEDGQLAAVSISFLGTETRDSRRPAMANLKMVAAYWGARSDVWHDASYELFVRQRNFAVQQGIRLITWTLDPLDSAVVHLSVRSLGAVTNRYVANYYGSNGAANKDRLIMEWWTTNRRVEERLNGNRGPLSLRAYLEANTPIVNPTRSENGWTVPLVPNGVPISGTLALLEIPDNWLSMRAAAPDLAQDWREHLRVLAGRIFAEGYIVTDFLCEPHEGRQRCFYMLSRGSTTTFSES